MITTETLDRFGGLAWLDFTYPRYRPHLMMASPDGRVAAVQGSIDGKPAGLILAAITADNVTASIGSIYVAPEFRRRGLGRKLMEHLERDLRSRGVRQITIGYFDRPTTGVPLLRIMTDLAWNAPELERIICHANNSILNAKWIARPLKLPAGYEIFPWSELRDEERDALLASQSSNPWIGEWVNPFKGDGTFAFNSVGLRRRGEVVGWLVTDEYDSQTLMYSCSYIRPDLQAHGFIVPLYAAAIRRHAERGEEFPKVIFVVPSIYPTMIRFVQRRVSPFNATVDEYKFSRKSLEPVAA